MAASSHGIGFSESIEVDFRFGGAQSKQYQQMVLVAYFHTSFSKSLSYVCRVVVTILENETSSEASEDRERNQDGKLQNAFYGKP